MVKHVLGQLAQPFVVIETPGGGDGASVKEVAGRNGANFEDRWPLRLQGLLTIHHQFQEQIFLSANWDLHRDFVYAHTLKIVSKTVV